MTFDLDRTIALLERTPASLAALLDGLPDPWIRSNEGHDLTHLHQIARVMAHQYRDEVGPWTRFLGVLRCQGHSEPA